MNPILLLEINFAPWPISQMNGNVYSVPAIEFY